jgi:hypothetical protein
MYKTCNKALHTVLIRSYTHTNVGSSSGYQVNSKPVACAEKDNHVCKQG